MNEHVILTQSAFVSIGPNMGSAEFQKKGRFVANIMRLCDGQATTEAFVYGDSVAAVHALLEEGRGYLEAGMPIYRVPCWEPYDRIKCWKRIEEEAAAA